MELEWCAAWQEVWKRDNPYIHDYDAVLDRKTGGVAWMSREEGILLSREETAEASALISSDPGRYELIPPLDHGSHHEIFADWLNTIPSHIRDLCNTASIGGFRQTLEKDFPQDARELWEDWQEFHDRELKRHAESWLRERGIDPVWR